MNFPWCQVLWLIRPKNSVFMGGISEEVQCDILRILQMPKGEFLVRYLGIPLTTRKLQYCECRSLVEKKTTRVTYWSSRALSYAGRLQLVKLILDNMQSKLDKEVIAVCRNFLCAGQPLLLERLLWIGLPFVSLALVVV